MDSTPMDVALLSNLAGEPVAYSCRNPLRRTPAAAVS